MPVKVLRKKYMHLKEQNPETGQDGIVAEYAVSMEHTHIHTPSNCGLHSFLFLWGAMLQCHIAGIVTITFHPLVQKLESLSLIDESWLVSGTLPANTHKNRSKDVLPCECACHLYTFPSLCQLQCLGHVQYASVIGVVSLLFSHSLSLPTILNLSHRPLPSPPSLPSTPLPSLHSTSLFPQMIPIVFA